MPTLSLRPCPEFSITVLRRCPARASNNRFTPAPRWRRASFNPANGHNSKSTMTFLKWNPKTGTYQTSNKKILIAARFFKENPDGLIPSGVWDCPAWSAAQFAKWFRKCLAEKINRNEPKTRKTSDEYKWLLLKDAREIRDCLKRKRCGHVWRGRYLETPELRKRYRLVSQSFNLDEY